MAYEIGTFQTTVNDAQGKPTSSVGKFVVNWQKRDGQCDVNWAPPVSIAFIRQPHA
jgi:hypothetical protein